MTTLREAAQDALNWLYENDIVHPTAVSQDLRAALEQQAEPVSHAVIAGALFDFMGWLTTRKERLVLSSTDNASPAVESITEFAKMRGLSLNNAKVQDWNTSPPQRKPMTDEMVHRAMVALNTASCGDLQPTFEEMRAALKAAHGIKEKS